MKKKEEIIGMNLACSLWGSNEVDFVFQESEGLSGGIFSMWKKGSLDMLSSMEWDGFIGVSIIRDGKVFHTINIYSPCSLEGKRKLWNDLLSL